MKKNGSYHTLQTIQPLCQMVDCYSLHMLSLVEAMLDWQLLRLCLLSDDVFIGH